MKRFAIALVGLVVSTPSPSARADGEAQSEGGDIPGLILSEEQNKCLDQCLTGQAPTCPAATSCPPASACPPAPVCVEAKKEVKRQAKERHQQATNKLRERRKNIRVIKKQIEVAKVAEPPCPECVEKLRKELDTERQRIDNLEQLKDAFKKLSETVVPNLIVKVNNLAIKVDDYEGRIKVLEGQAPARKRFELDLVLGGHFLQSLDGTRITAGSVGIGAGWQFVDKWWLQFRTSLLVSNGTADPVAIGTSIRGGVRYDFHPMWGVSLGGYASWTGLDSHLLPKQVNSGGYFGFEFRYKMLVVNADLLLTGEFDDGTPAFAPGGAIYLGARW